MARVDVARDTLGVEALRASIVTNLTRAKLRNGARRYTFTMEFMP